MKFLIVSLLFGFVVTSSSNCSSSIKNAPIELRALYTKDALINAIGILQDAAIGAEAQHVIHVDQARPIVEFCNSSLKVIRDSEDGWKSTVNTGLNQLQINVDTSRFNSLIQVIRTILVGVQ